MTISSKDCFTKLVPNDDTDIWTKKDCFTKVLPNDDRDIWTAEGRVSLAKEVFQAVYGTPQTATMFPRDERSFAHLCGDPLRSKVSWSHYLACSKAQQYGPHAVRCYSIFGQL